MRDQDRGTLQIAKLASPHPVFQHRCKILTIENYPMAYQITLTPEQRSSALFQECCSLRQPSENASALELLYIFFKHSQFVITPESREGGRTKRETRCTPHKSCSVRIEILASLVWMQIDHVGEVLLALQRWHATGGFFDWHTAAHASFDARHHAHSI
jgi:hypothetical protein